MTERRRDDVKATLDFAAHEGDGVFSGERVLKYVAQFSKDEAVHFVIVAARLLYNFSCKRNRDSTLQILNL